MHLLATGAAFVDRSGAIVAADPGFVARLGLDARDPTGRGHDVRLPQIQRTIAQRSPVRSQAGFATDGERADSFCRRWIRNVDRRSGQSPEARRQLSFAAEGMEMRLVVDDCKRICRCS